MSFNERLREERLSLGLSQIELGALGGVALNAQGNYESGKRSPDATYLSLVAAAGIDVLYVLTGHRSHDIDTSMFGYCEAALRLAYRDARPASTGPLVFRSMHVCRMYGRVMRDRRPDEDDGMVLAAAAEAMIQMYDDPSDPEQLDRVLLQPTLGEPAVLHGGTSLVVTGGKNKKIAGRDFHTVTIGRDKGPSADTKKPKKKK